MESLRKSHIKLIVTRHEQTGGASLALHFSGHPRLQRADYLILYPSLRNFVCH